jgi:ATP-dependent protease Clp ATPase subunit
LGIYEKVKGGNVDFNDRVEIDDVNGKISHTGPVGSGVTAMANQLEGIIATPCPGCVFIGDVPADDKSA